MSIIWSLPENQLKACLAACLLDSAYLQNPQNPLRPTFSTEILGKKVGRKFIVLKVEFIAPSTFVGLARQANRFLSRQKSGEKSDPLARVIQTKRGFSRRRPNSPSALAQTMSAFTLEKPRPLGTRKRGFESTEFNGQIS